MCSTKKVIQLFSIFLLCALQGACTFSLPFSSPTPKLYDQHAQSFSVLLVYGNGAKRAQGQRVFAKVRDKLKEQTNIELLQWDSISLSKHVYRNDVGSFISTWKEGLENYGTYDIVYLFLPESAQIPYHHDSAAGFAQGVGLTGKVPNAIAMSILSGDSDRDQWAMMHEIGHLLGAEHSSRGVMRRDSEPEHLEYSIDSLAALAGHSKALAAQRERGRSPFVQFSSYSE